MKTIPVMVMRNKTNQERYLAASMEVGDWEDENLDVTIKDIQDAYMIVRNDLTTPTQKDFEDNKALHAEHKRIMIEKYGPKAMISLDFEGVCEAYEPVIVEITQEQFEHAVEMMED